MKILFLTPYPRSAPSSRYRVYQMIPYLESVGIQCDVLPLLSEDEFQLSRQQGLWAKKTLITIRAFWQRLRVTGILEDYDLVYLLKSAFPYGPPVIEHLLSRANVPFVFDFDDAIQFYKPSVHHRLLDWMKSSQRVRKTIQLADHVLVPNDYLADYTRQFNAQVSVIPEAEDTARLIPRGTHQNGKQIVIGWIGSPSTAKYLQLISPALTTLCQKYPHLVIQVIGGKYEAPGVRTEHIEWSLQREVELFHGLDIGIMPLPLDDWSRGKSGCKLRQYMATGVPGVATDIGFNRELVRHGETGMLVRTQEDWVRALSQLIESPNLRNQIAKSARQSVVDRFAHSVIGPVLAEKLFEIGRTPSTSRVVSSKLTSSRDRSPRERSLLSQ